MLKGAEIVLRCLRAEGVDLVFGYPGGAIMPLYDALEGSGVRHMLTRHEQGAVFAAEGYARVNRQSWRGDGDQRAGRDESGHWHRRREDGFGSAGLHHRAGAQHLIGTDAFQETDVFGVTLSLTKWSRLVRTIEEIPAAIAEGFHWARSGRPGPVVIDIPTDILKAKIEFAGPVKFKPHGQTGGC